MNNGINISEKFGQFLFFTVFAHRMQYCYLS
jgi:hypothetical protein